MEAWGALRVGRLPGSPERVAGPQPTNPMRVEDFIDELLKSGVRLFTGVPCSFFQSAYALFRGQRSDLYIPAANEGVALAVATGAELAGVKTAVLIQNSGIGNLVNPLTSLNAPYALPSLLFVSGRGFGVTDEPQHELMGRITQGLLELCGARTWVMSPDVDAFREQLAEAGRCRTRDACVVAFVVPKDTLRAPDGVDATPTCEAPLRPLSRATVLRITQELAPSNAALLATTGQTSRELFALSDDPRTFYCMGSMGHVTGVALGVALGDRTRFVIALDGDGAALMHLGALSTIGACAPKNLIHVIVDNEAYATTGNQPTTSGTTDFAAVARACGYRSSSQVATEASFRNALSESLRGAGPAMIHAKVNLDATLNAPRITSRYSAPEIAMNFSRFLTHASRTEGNKS